MLCLMRLFRVFFFFFQAEDGIRDLVRSRGLGDVYKRQIKKRTLQGIIDRFPENLVGAKEIAADLTNMRYSSCLLYTSDAADERSSVDLGGRRIIKKKNKES